MIYSPRKYRGFGLRYDILPARLSALLAILQVTLLMQPPNSLTSPFSPRSSKRRISRRPVPRVSMDYVKLADRRSPFLPWAGSRSRMFSPALRRGGAGIDGISLFQEKDIAEVVLRLKG